MKKIIVALALVNAGWLSAQMLPNVAIPEGATVSPYSFGGWRFLELNQSGKVGVIDTLKGVIIPPTFTQIEMLGNNLEAPSKFLFAVYQGQKLGFYSLEGKELQPFQFDSYTIETNGTESSFIMPSIVIDDDNTRIGIMNFDGKLVVPVNYTRLQRLDGTREAFHLIGTPEDRVGVVKNFETILLPPIYSDIYVQMIRQRNFLFVTDEHERSGILDNNGKIIVPFGSSTNEYSDDIYSQGPGTAYFGFRTKKGAGYSASDKGIIIQPVYNNIERVQLAGQDFFQLAKGKKYGLADGEGKIIVPVQYQRVEVVQADDAVFIVAKRKDAYGLLDAKGNVVAPFLYTWIEPNVTDDGLFSLSNKVGEYYLSRALKVISINE